MNLTYSTTYKEETEEERRHSPKNLLLPPSGTGGHSSPSSVCSAMPLLREAQTKPRSPSSFPLSSIGNIWESERVGGGCLCSFSKALCGEMTIFITRNTESHLGTTSRQRTNSVRRWNLQRGIYQRAVYLFKQPRKNQYYLVNFWE